MERRTCDFFAQVKLRWAHYGIGEIYRKSVTNCRERFLCRRVKGGERVAGVILRRIAGEDDVARGVERRAQIEENNAAGIRRHRAEIKLQFDGLSDLVEHALCGGFVVFEKRIHKRARRDFYRGKRIGQRSWAFVFRREKQWNRRAFWKLKF